LTTPVKTALLEIKNASVSFGSKTVWKDLDLRVSQGEFIAVIGANGSGKTVLLKAILGQLPLRKDQSRFLGNQFPWGLDKLDTFPSTGNQTMVSRFAPKTYFAWDWMAIDLVSRFHHSRRMRG
jgi:ABC-type molybdenum transport system ATPase subunit/photorepair protein PhrA